MWEILTEPGSMVTGAPRLADEAEGSRAFRKAPVFHRLQNARPQPAGMPQLTSELEAPRSQSGLLQRP